MLNKVILMGRICNEIELKQTNNGTAVTSFTLAVDRNYSGKGEEKQTDFINCVAWRKTAEFLANFFTKGRMIAVEGSLQVRNYEDKNGNKRQAVEVIVDQAYFADSKNATQPNTDSNAKPIVLNESNATFNAEIDNEDDLPFN